MIDWFEFAVSHISSYEWSVETSLGRRLTFSPLRLTEVSSIRPDFAQKHEVTYMKYHK